MKEMDMIEVILLVIGATSGAYLRHIASQCRLIVGGLSVDILFINLIGSFVLGLFSVLAPHFGLDARHSLLIAVGFCGSLTTMSSFALETSLLIESGEVAATVINIVANTSLSIGAVIFGRALTSILIGRF